MTDDEIREKVARAILETDPTCDYDACKKRQAAGGAWAELNANWWESLHEQADNALSACGYFEMRRALEETLAALSWDTIGTYRMDDPDWYTAVYKAKEAARSALSKAGGS